MRALLRSLMALVLLAGMARAEIAVQEITSESGVTAWLLEDHSLPLVTLRFAFEGGSRADPEGLSGTAYLMSGLMDEGAGEMASEAFLSAVDDAGAELSFFVRDGYFGGSLRVLREDAPEALALLSLAVTDPRFDEAPVERIRRQILSSLAAQQADPQAQASLARDRALYGDHPFARNRKGDMAELARVTRADLHAFHAAQFTRDRLHVAVVGAVSEADLAGWLDRVFGALPETAPAQAAAVPEPTFGQTVRIAAPTPSTTILMTWPAPAQRDADFPVAAVMNHIFGAAPMSSRLFDELRNARGLVYGVNTALDPEAITPQFLISTQTRTDRLEETLSVIDAELARLAEDGPGAAELAEAKAYLSGVFFVRNFGGSAAAAETLLSLQMAGLAPRYLADRATLYDGVTAEDVRRFAATLAAMKPAVLLIGPEAASN
ncbi:M16 family metallopeptidase [Tropicibacter sp. S64]|uniref:M16 family metallopeptidase n=1 Tax=Tropicibacter sp. S64 TaxID=3415122 RepID=UPI003C7ACD00